MAEEKEQQNEEVIPELAYMVVIEPDGTRMGKATIQSVGKTEMTVAQIHEDIEHRARLIEENRLQRNVQRAVLSGMERFFVAQSELQENIEAVAEKEKNKQ